MCHVFLLTIESLQIQFAVVLMAFMNPIMPVAHSAIIVAIRVMAQILINVILVMKPIVIVL